MAYLRNVDTSLVPFAISQYHKQVCCFDSILDFAHLRGLFDEGVVNVFVDELSITQGTTVPDTRWIALNEYFGEAQHIGPLFAGIFD